MIVLLWVMLPFLIRLWLLSAGRGGASRFVWSRRTVGGPRGKWRKGTKGGERPHWTNGEHSFILLQFFEKMCVLFLAGLQKWATEFVAQWESEATKSQDWSDSRYSVLTGCCPFKLFVQMIFTLPWTIAYYGVTEWLFCEYMLNINDPNH